MMQDILTRSVAKYVSEKGIAVTTIAEKTGLPYNPLIASLSPIGKRKLRADEYLGICGFLGIDPKEFATTPQNDKSA